MAEARADVEASIESYVKQHEPEPRAARLAAGAAEPPSARTRLRSLLENEVAGQAALDERLAALGTR